MRRALYYAHGFLRESLPPALWQALRPDRLAWAESMLTPEQRRRVDYYNRLDAPFPVPEEALSLRSLPSGGQTTYYLDFRDLARWFPQGLRACHLFGDVRHVPEVPTFVKSRPLEPDHRAAVLLRLNRIRHFRFVRNDRPFRSKSDTVVWRGKCLRRQSRIACVERYARTPGCDIGDTDPKARQSPQWKPFLSIAEQLRSKFVLSIEGNDVASNLKWILSSNSLCLMARPHYETWFMEGTLQPGVHYVEVRADHADLLEKREHYLAHPEQAEAIIANAHRHVARFRDPRVEQALGLLVMKKYFALSGQLPEGGLRRARPD
jgi:hypothetical protein